MKTRDHLGLVDMDGTICDYDAQLRLDYEKVRSPSDPPFIPFQKNAPNYVKARIDLIRNQTGWGLNLPEYQPGFDILNLAKELEFQINILTKGPRSSPNAWTEKLQWAMKHVPGAAVTVTENKGLVYGTFLVDDYPEYVESWLEWRPRGLAILPLNENNKGFKHPSAIIYDGTNLKEVRELMIRARDR
jgi:hypothetical protein